MAKWQFDWAEFCSQHAIYIFRPLLLLTEMFITPLVGSVYLVSAVCYDFDFAFDFFLNYISSCLRFRWFFSVLDFDFILATLTQSQNTMHWMPCIFRRCVCVFICVWKRFFPLQIFCQTQERLALMLVQRDTVDGNIDLCVWVSAWSMSMCEKVKGNAGPPLLQEEKTGEEETMHVCVRRFNWIDGPHLFNCFVGGYVCMCNLKPFDPTAKAYTHSHGKKSANVSGCKCVCLKTIKTQSILLASQNAKSTRKQLQMQKTRQIWNWIVAPFADLSRMPFSRSALCIHCFRFFFCVLFFAFAKDS